MGENVEKSFLAILFTMLFFVSFVFLINMSMVTAADTGTDKTNDLVAITREYNAAKQVFLDAKNVLKTCEDKGKECKKEGNKVLEPARTFTEKSMNLMLARLKALKESKDIDADTKLNLADAISSFTDLKTELKDAEGKEEIIGIAKQAKEAWANVKDSVEQQTTLLLKNSISEMIGKSFNLADLTRCTLDKLKKDGADILSLQTDLALFENNVEDAQAKLDALAKSDKSIASESYKEDLKMAKTSVVDAKKVLASLLGKIKSKNGALCAQDEVTEAQKKKHKIASMEAPSNETAADAVDEQVSQEELHTVLGKYNILNDYDTAVKALDDAEKYIQDKESNNYDATAARQQLNLGQQSLANILKKIQNNQVGGVFTAVLNAKNLANEAMKNNYLVLKKKQVEKAAGTLEAFKACAAQSSYLYQRNKCYHDFKVSDVDKKKVEDCLTAGEKQKDQCYDYAASAKEDASSGQALAARIQTLRTSLTGLEDDVNNLYDDLNQANGAASAKSTIQTRIDLLLHDVQNDKINFMNELNDIENTASDGDSIQAGHDLDTLDDDINGFEGDKRSVLNNISDDISAL